MKWLVPAVWHHRTCRPRHTMINERHSNQHRQYCGAIMGVTAPSRHKQAMVGMTVKMPRTEVSISRVKLDNPACRVYCAVVYRPTHAKRAANVRTVHRDVNRWLDGVEVCLIAHQAIAMRTCTVPHCVRWRLEVVWTTNVWPTGMYRGRCRGSSGCIAQEAMLSQSAGECKMRGARRSPNK